MANIKITDLGVIADPISTDVLPIVDVSADTTNKISIETLLKNAAAGTAALPAFAFDDDPDTGMYRTGADGLGFSTGGTGRLFIDSSGNVGVGAASSGSKLEVYANNSAASGLLTLNQDGTGDATLDFVLTGTREYTLGIDNSDSDKFKLAGTAGLGTGDLLTITSSGDVGVGSTSPTHRLEVESASPSDSGGIRVTNAAFSNNLDKPFLIASTSSWNGANTNWGTYGYQFKMKSDVNGVGRMAIDTANSSNTFEALSVLTNGDIGIGATSPDYNLDIHNRGTEDTSLRLYNTGTGSSSDTILRCQIAGTTASNYIYFGDTHDNDIGRIRYLHSNNSMTFRTNASDALTIDSSQQVGIGTASPGEKLTVASGNIQLQGTTYTDFSDFWSSAGGNNAAFFTPYGFLGSNGAFNVSLYANGYRNSSSGFTYMDINGNTDTAAGIDLDPAGKIYFRTGTASGTAPPTRVTIDEAGEVGIGTSSPTQKLQVAGAIVSTGAANTYSADGIYLQNKGSSIFDISAWRSGASASVLTFSTDSGNDAAPVERMRINTTGYVGLGESSPDVRLHLKGAGSSNSSVRLENTSGPNVQQLVAGVVGVNNTGFSVYDVSNTTTTFRIDDSGNVGIGTNSPSANLDIAGATYANLFLTDIGDGTSAAIYGDGGAIDLRANNSTDNRLLVTTGSIRGYTGGSERVRIDSSGRLLVGTSTARSNFYNSNDTTHLQLEATTYKGSALSLTRNSANAASGGLILGKTRGTSIGSNTVVQSGDEIGKISFQGADGSQLVEGANIKAEIDGTPGADDMPGRLEFSTTANGASSPTERMRIDNSGNIYFNTTDISLYNNNASDGGGAGFFTNELGVAKYQANVAYFNRMGNDGTIIKFFGQGNNEGDISVSGSTVSLNGAHLSRWSQLPGGVERTEILRGSVLSNIDEMCEWGDEDNEQLNRMQVSNVEGDRNVAGVFQCWDDDDDTYTNDFYCAMTGDFVIRIAQGTTVARGDLLMSAGDGTAKPQDDDIVRSKTIAKVTSTNVSCTYADGSYCVPCVLMAC